MMMIITDIDISALLDLYHGAVDFIYYVIDFLPRYMSIKHSEGLQFVCICNQL